MTATIKKHIQQNFSKVTDKILSQYPSGKLDLWVDYHERPPSYIHHQPNLMIDIETLDIESSAVVLSIGATEFVIHNESELGFLQNGKINPNVRPKARLISGFYAELFCKPQISAKRTVGLGTMDFWKDQKPGLEQFPWFDDSNRDGWAINVQILKNLATRLGKPNQVVWANGTDFDLGILKSLFRTCGLPFTVPFFSQRDYRTIANMAPKINNAVPINKEYPENKMLHHALADAIHQTLKLQTAYQILSGRPLNEEQQDDEY